MRKNEFLDELRKRLLGLPEEELGSRLEFYVEMIDDKIEEGLSEEEAVASIGTLDEIEDSILSEFSVLDVVRERLIQIPRTVRPVWQIALLVLLSPIIFSLAVAAVSVAVSLYAAMWSALALLWVTFVVLVVGAPAAIVSGIILAFGGAGATGAVMMCAGLVSAGLAIFAFFGCKEATRGVIVLTKNIALWIKRLFIKGRVSD